MKLLRAKLRIKIHAYSKSSEIYVKLSSREFFFIIFFNIKTFFFVQPRQRKTKNLNSLVCSDTLCGKHIIHINEFYNHIYYFLCKICLIYGFSIINIYVNIYSKYLYSAFLYNICEIELNCPKKKITIFS